VAVLVEGDKSFFLSVPAVLVSNDRECASDWAAKHIRPNKWFKWVLAKYVEADNPNLNNQYWSLGDLVDAQSSIANTPMNVGHRATEIVGTWTNAEMMYPHDGFSNPYIEALGAFWRFYFPDMMAMVQSAYDIGSLAVSMECISETISCIGEQGCGQTYEYMGAYSETYCDHLNSHRSVRRLNKPHFLAGALVLPPDNPAWPFAGVKELSTTSSDESKDAQLASIGSTFDGLEFADMERLMFALQAHAASHSVVPVSKKPVSLIASNIASSFLADSYR